MVYMTVHLYKHYWYGASKPNDFLYHTSGLRIKHMFYAHITLHNIELAGCAITKKNEIQAFLMPVK